MNRLLSKEFIEKTTDKAIFGAILIALFVLLIVVCNGAQALGKFLVAFLR